MKNPDKYICVFCGANLGNNDIFRAAACDTAKAIVHQGYGLVYGGGSIGMMGTIATEVLKLGGKVIGVIPEKLATIELSHPDVDQMIVVKDMHERKAKMGELSHGFLTLPGGFGTLEELFEVVSWSQLQYHNKPIGILNVHNFYKPLYEHILHTVQFGFIHEHYLDLIIMKDEPEELLRSMKV